MLVKLSIETPMGLGELTINEKDEPSEFSFSRDGKVICTALLDSDGMYVKEVRGMALASLLPLIAEVLEKMEKGQFTSFGGIK